MDAHSVILVKPYDKKKREANWKTWLNEYVYADFRDETSVMKRYQSYQYFCKEGLIPFVTAHKYVLNPNYDLPNELANLLYNGNGKDPCCRVQPFFREINNRLKMDIDFDYYTSRGIPDEDWNIFWNEWKWMTDFYDEKFRNRLLLPKFVYDRLNLDSSEATFKLSEELDEYDDSDEYSSHVDQASDAIGQGKDKNSLY